jgi:DinB family protein
MQYMRLNTEQREDMLAALAGMPEFLKSAFAELTDEQTRTRGQDGSLSPIEQVWHLADLEREGFKVRIGRLLAEADPYLPDFNGAKIAADRNYRSLSFEEGVAAFTAARRDTVAALRTIDTQSWFRSGTQEGVGTVSLCDIPSFMFQHDTAHKTEIEAWKASMIQ